MEIINKNNFSEKVENNNKVCLVDFFGTWCMPCKMMGGILEEFEPEIKNFAVIYKVDVDESPELAKKYGIMAVPSIIVFKNGTEVEKIVGVKDIESLRDTITPYFD